MTAGMQIFTTSVRGDRTNDLEGLAGRKKWITYIEEKSGLTNIPIQYTNLTWRPCVWNINGWIFPPEASQLYLYRSLKRSVRWELSDKWLLLPWQPWPWPAAATMSSPLPAPAAWSACSAHNILTNSQYPYTLKQILYIIWVSLFPHVHNNQRRPLIGSQ